MYLITWFIKKILDQSRNTIKEICYTYHTVELNNDGNALPLVRWNIYNKGNENVTLFLLLTNGYRSNYVAKFWN